MLNEANPGPFDPGTSHALEAGGVIDGAYADTHSLRDEPPRPVAQDWDGDPLSERQPSLNDIHEPDVADSSDSDK